MRTIANLVGFAAIVGELVWAAQAQAADSAAPTARQPNRVTVQKSSGRPVANASRVPARRTQYGGEAVVETAPSVGPAQGGWAPGGYEGRVGSPYHYSATDPHGQGGTWGAPGAASMGAPNPGYLPGDPYSYHFGPGYYRHSEMGNYRFPYYSYRRPWYHPGPPSYTRDTNYPW